MKVNIKFIVITAVFVLFAAGLGGGYYFFKEGKKLVADYSLGLSENLLQTNKAPRIGNSSHFILSKSAEFPLDLAPI